MTTSTGSSATLVGAGFLSDFVPVAFASAVNVAVVGFDVVSDWLAYRAFAALLAADDHGAPSDHGANPLAVQRLLATAFFACCVVASVVNAAELARCCYVLSRRHRRFLNQRDGLPVKASARTRLAGEAMTTLQVLSEDLPLSAIILIFQARLGCSLVLPFDAAIFGVSLSACGLSVAWKTALVVWRAGCANLRDKFYSSRPVTALRSVTLAILAGTSVVVVLNAILFASDRYTLPSAALRSSLFDKISMDEWVARDHIVLQRRAADYVIDNVTHLVRLQRVIDRRGRDVIVQVPCLGTYALPPRDAIVDDVNCSVTYVFRFSAERQQITYNYGLALYYANGSCETGPMCETPACDRSLQALISPTSSDDNTPTHNSTYNIALSSQVTGNVTGCGYPLVYDNATLLLNPCSS